MKDFKLLEHNLIPASLFVLNMSVVHLVYLVFMREMFSVVALLIFACTIVMITGVIKKNKFMMIPATILYILALTISF